MSSRERFTVPSSVGTERLHRAPSGRASLVLLTSLALGAGWTTSLGCGSRSGLDLFGAGAQHGADPGSANDSGGGAAEGSGSGSASGGTRSGSSSGSESGSGGGHASGAPCASTCGSQKGLTVLASGQDTPVAIAVDSTNVYWMNQGTGYGGTVMKVPLCGGTPVTLAAVDAGRIGGLAVGREGIYYTHFTDGTVMRLPLGGGVPSVFASGLPSPSGIAVDRANVYWADFFAGIVVSEPLGGGVVTTLSSGQSGPDGIAVDAENVYWTNDVPIGTVLKASLAGGPPIGVGGGDHPKAIAVGGGIVAWATAKNVMAAPIVGGSPTVLHEGASTYTTLAVDGANVYWGDKSSPVIDSAPVGGGTTTTVSSATFPLGITVDCSSLYWTDVGGTVKKFTPK